MKRIIIADILSHTYQGKSTGHYFAVARNYQDMFGDRAVVAGGPVYSTGFSNNVLLKLPYNAGGGGIKGRFKTFANAIHLFSHAKNDIIVLQQCTTITSLICIILFYHQKSKLFLIQYSRECFRSWIGKVLFVISKKKISGIICPNDMVGLAFSPLPYCVVPDYIFIPNSNRIVKQYEERKYDFCMIGRIAPEKGVVEICKILAGKSCRIIVAGKPQNIKIANELTRICQSASNIELNLGYLSDEDYKNYLNDSRYAILNYSDEYSERSSGVVLDTIFNGVPVVGRRCKSLQFVEDNHLGILYDSFLSVDLLQFQNIDSYNYLLRNIDQYRTSSFHNRDILLTFIS